MGIVIIAGLALIMMLLTLSGLWRLITGLVKRGLIMIACAAAILAVVVVCYPWLLNLPHWHQRPAAQGLESR